MRVLPVFVVLCLLGADLALLAGSETTSEFTQYDEKLDSAVYDFYEADRNGSVTLEFPASTVTSVSLTIRGEELEGSYPSDVELQVRSDQNRALFQEVKESLFFMIDERAGDARNGERPRDAYSSARKLSDQRRAR